FLRFVARRIYDLSALEFQTDTIESNSLINAGRIKGHMTLYRILHWTAENFAIGDIAITTADYGWNSLDTDTQIGAGTFDLDTVRLFHQPLEHLHAGLKFAIVQRADIEIDVFKCLGAHSGKLRHRRSRPAYDHPLGFFTSLVLHRAHFSADQFHLLRRY